MHKNSKNKAKQAFIDFFKIYLTGTIIAFIYFFYFASIFIKKPKKLKQILKTRQPIVFAFFHQDLFSLFKLFYFSRSLIMASQSRDGRTFATMLKYFFYRPIYGSRHRNGKKAMYKTIELFNKKKAKAILIAVDGSKGPIYKVKAGAIKIALETGASIVPIGFKYSKYFMLKKAWDKTIIPKPFTRVQLKIGKLMTVSKNDNFEKKLKTLEIELQKIKVKEFLDKYLDNNINNSTRT